MFLSKLTRFLFNCFVLHLYIIRTVIYLFASIISALLFSCFNETFINYLIVLEVHEGLKSKRKKSGLDLQM